MAHADRAACRMALALPICQRYMFVPCNVSPQHVFRVTERLGYKPNSFTPHMLYVTYFHVTDVARYRVVLLHLFHVICVCVTVFCVTDAQRYRLCTLQNVYVKDVLRHRVVTLLLFT